MVGDQVVPRDSKAVRNHANAARGLVLRRYKFDSANTLLHAVEIMYLLVNGRNFNV